MKTFKIFNNNISFDEGLIDYIEILQSSEAYKVNFNDRYIAIQSKKITTIEDFTALIQELYDYIPKEFIKVSDELVNLYIKYNIYDVSSSIIQTSNIHFLNNHLQNMAPLIDEIDTFSSQVKAGIINIHDKWKEMVDDAVQGHYFDVYSTKYSDILLNEYFNHREQKRVEKKRQRLYEQNANKSVNDYLSQVIGLCQEYTNKMKDLIYDDALIMIDSMYKNCAKDLFEKGKISKIVQNTDTLKTQGILENLNRIGNRETLEEQLVKILQAEPFNYEVHLKVLEYITNNDFAEYAKLIEFLKLENMIFHIYLSFYVQGEQGNKNINDKCLNVLKLLKDSLNIEMILKKNINFDFSDDAFLESISFLRKYFDGIKKIYGNDNKLINEKEQKIFVEAAKAASNGTNLVYDGSLNQLNYTQLYQFWEKTKTQRFYTAKRTEVTQKVSSGVAIWIKNHPKIVILIIILIIIYLAGKD